MQPAPDILSIGHYRCFACQTLNVFSVSRLRRQAQSFQKPTPSDLEKGGLHGMDSSCEIGSPSLSFNTPCIVVNNQEKNIVTTTKEKKTPKPNKTPLKKITSGWIIVICVLIIPRWKNISDFEILRNFWRSSVKANSLGAVVSYNKKNMFRKRRLENGLRKKWGIVLYLPDQF